MKRAILLSLLLVVCLAAVAAAKDKFIKVAPVKIDKDGEKWALKTLKSMSLEEKIGQMFMVWARAEFVNFNSPDYAIYRDTMKKYNVGGFAVSVRVDGPFLLRNQPYEMAMLTNQLQRDSKWPLLMAADFERGVSMRLYGTTVFPHAMAFGAAGKPEYAEAFGRITAEESRALGIHWNFFPVADVNSNPVNPVINTRSFGGDATQVGDLLAAYIRGARAAGMLTTAKHFPGHGDTATDSHLGVASVPGDRARLDAVELPPFQRAIDAGVDSVMIAHVTVPALDPDPKVVSTISKPIVTDLLKGKMHFEGLVVTDAMEMRGLTVLFPPSPGVNTAGRAAVAAIKAGNDVILVPSDLEGSIKGIVEAVRSGEIPESVINASVLKILRYKASVGLNKARLVDVDQIAYTVLKPENVKIAQQIAEDAVTLVRGNAPVLPLKATPREGTSGPAIPYTQIERIGDRVLALIFTDDSRLESGRAFERALRARVPEARIMYVDSRNAEAVTPRVLEMVSKAETVVVPVYVIPVAGKAVTVNGQLTNSVSLDPKQGALLKEILKQASPKTVVLAMGNPYLGSEFPEILTYICTFSNATVSEVAAVRALFGEIPLRGKLPVTIPGFAERGEGLERPAVQAAAGR